MNFHCNEAMNGAVKGLIILCYFGEKIYNGIFYI